MIGSVKLTGPVRAPSFELQTTAPSPTPAGSDFMQVMASVAGEAVDTMRAAEATAISGVRGHAPVQDVVDAVMAAERSLQTGLALRDKAVAAYQEISRMAI